MLELSKQVSIIAKRPIFYWITAVFNRFSEERVKEVGPDRACAEWLLRNGAQVKWKNAKVYLTDYNALPSDEEGVKNLFIHGVDATDSGISHEGFPHFAGCKFIEEMKLVNCVYIGNQALDGLTLLKDCLKYLEIRNCGYVSEKGLDSLKNLTCLESLKISNLQAIKDTKAAHERLKKNLPHCQISFE